MTAESHSLPSFLTRRPCSDSRPVACAHIPSSGCLSLSLTSDFVTLPSPSSVLPGSYNFHPVGWGVEEGKVSSSLLICLPISLSHTQFHLNLKHPQARVFQCQDRHRVRTSSMALNSEVMTQINQVAQSLDCTGNLSGKRSVLCPLFSPHTDGPSQVFL